MRDFHQPGRSLTYAANGMAATSHPLASDVAIETLKSGGNAMDAALAGAVLLGICEPQMTGIGGDLFVLWSPAGSEDVHALNGSGRAPAGIDAGALRDAGHTKIDILSPSAVTIPGAVDAICTLSETCGKIGLDRVLQPAIHYAEAGIPVAPRVARDWKAEHENLQGYGRDVYLQNGKPYGEGDNFALPGVAEALRRIAQQGRQGFYDGEVAEDMLAVLGQAGGPHTLQDFADCRSDAADPISQAYKDVEVLEHPPNGQGATALLILNILKHFDLGTMDPFGTDRAHLETEATKLAYDYRNRVIADPAHAGGAEAMLTENLARELASRIDMATAGPLPKVYDGTPHQDTVYITVVDKDGMSVSLIYSIFKTFGSGLTSPKFGILLHNRGAGFTLEPGHPNELGPGKRPLHTIIPAMCRQDGRVVMPFGVMGGQYQATGHARFLTNHLDYGMDIQSAIDAPRCFIENGELRLERGYAADVVQHLADRGHNVVVPDGPIGGAQAIKIDHARGVLIGASDPRKDGCALGY